MKLKINLRRNNIFLIAKSIFLHQNNLNQLKRVLFKQLKLLKNQFKIQDLLDIFLYIKCLPICYPQSKKKILLKIARLKIFPFSKKLNYQIIQCKIHLHWISLLKSKSHHFSLNCWFLHFYKMLQKILKHLKH